MMGLSFFTTRCSCHHWICSVLEGAYLRFTPIELSLFVVKTADRCSKEGGCPGPVGILLHRIVRRTCLDIVIIIKQTLIFLVFFIIKFPRTLQWPKVRCEYPLYS